MKYSKKILRLLSVAVATVLCAQLAFAEPYIAQRYGLQCSACHTNITGGGKRNDVGVAYAMTLTGSPVSSKFSPKIADVISMGANFRADATYIMFDSAKASPQGVVGSEQEDVSAFNVSNGLLYFDFTLSDKITLYLDQQVAPEGGRTREAFGLYRGLLGDNDYLKVGKFFLPYGLRLQDDDAFVRGMSGFNFNNSDIGIEYGAQRGSLAYSVAVTNGAQGAGENNTDKQVSSVVSFVQPKYRVGASFASNRSTGGSKKDVYGIFAGFTYGKWVFLGEVNGIESTADKFEPEPDTALVGFLSANYLVTPSTNLKFSYDYYDKDDTTDENERTRFSLLGETFYSQYSQLRYGIRRYDSIPQTTLENQTVIFSEYHVFF